jgi:hypothetical protein
VTRKIFKNRNKIDIPCPEPVMNYNQTRHINGQIIIESHDYLRRVKMHFLFLPE